MQFDFTLSPDMPTLNLLSQQLVLISCHFIRKTKLLSQGLAGWRYSGPNFEFEAHSGDAVLVFVRHFKLFSFISLILKSKIYIHTGLINKR